MNLEDWTNEFIGRLHSSTTVLSVGTATANERSGWPAVETYNRLYGQRVVWGPWGCERRKAKIVKYTEKTMNNYNTEGVTYEATDSL